MKVGGGLIGAFALMLLLSPPGIAVSEGIFDSQQFTKQIMLELKVAQVTNHPVLTRGSLYYLAEGGRKIAENDNNIDVYQCKERPVLTEEGVLAGMAEELASAPDYRIEELKSKYYCYRFDILSYFIAKHQNEALKRALDAGFNEYFISLKNQQPYGMLYLLNQAVFAENKGALLLLEKKIKCKKHIYFALVNFITDRDESINIDEEIEKRKHRYENRKVNYNDLVYAILHNDEYELATIQAAIPDGDRRDQYVKALNSLIDLRIRARKNR